MASLTKHKRGGYYLEIRPLPNFRKLIYLGKITKAIAERFKANIERIQRAAMLNLEDPEMQIWMAGLAKNMQAKLRDAGIAIPEAAKSWKVSDWLSHVTDTYPGADRTRKNLETARKHWDGYIGHRDLADVTTGDVRRCVERILAGSKQSHAVRICERGRMFFNRAIENNLIEKNPFDGLKFGTKKHDKSRQNYLPKATIDTVIQQATTAESRALIALARYCGLRVPSEPLSLTWADVDWDVRRLRIPSETKTGERTLPMFESHDYLRSLFEAAPDHSTHVFTVARASAATTWRKWLETAIISAKISQWEKLWVNLRASCRTDLEDEYPSHVCDSWLGHSSRVAKDHYDMVSPTHWEKASRTGPTSQALGSALG